MRRTTMLLPLLCALAAACDEKPGATVAPSPTAKADPVRTTIPSAAPLAPSATGSAGGSSAAVADPAGTLDYVELLKKVKEKKADWIGKEVVVRGPFHSNYEDLQNNQGFTYPEVGTPPDGVKVVLKNQADAAKLSPLSTGSAIIVARGKIRELSLGALTIIDAEIVDIRKNKK